MLNESPQVFRRLSAALPVALAIWYAAAPAHAQPPVKRVVVAEAQMRELKPSLALVGSVEPVRRSVIGAEIAGRVREMPVRQGDFVEQDAVLCRLKDETLQHQKSEQAAQLESLRQKLAELEAGTRSEDLERLKAALEEAAALEEKWAFEKKRLDDLMATSSASSKEFNDTTSEYLAARKRHTQAKAIYDLAVEGPRKEVIEQARYAVAAQEAVVARLAEDVERTRIRAPFAGYVTRRIAEVGEWVEVGGDVVELADLSSVLVRVSVPEQAFPFNRVGDDIRVKIDALDEWLTGHIAHVIPQADMNARTFPVEIRIENGDGRLAAGMFARAVVRAGATRPGVAVPVDAIVRRDGIEYVAMVLDPSAGRPGADAEKHEGQKNEDAPPAGGPPGGGGHGGPPAGPKAMPTPVTTGVEVDGWVAVTSGNIGPGMKVVIRGNEGIFYPMPVEIVTIDAFQSAAAPATPAAEAKVRTE